MPLKWIPAKRQSQQSIQSMPLEWIPAKRLESIQAIPESMPLAH
jgi:hypothetical protein